MSNEKFSVKQLFQRKEPRYVLKGVRVTSKVFWNLFLIFAAVALIGAVFAGGAAAGYFASLIQDEPIHTYEEMEKRIYDYEEATEIYFADEVYLGDMPSPLERREVDLENISSHLVNAVIATEDEYFFEHEGVVPKALFRAVYQDFSNAATQTGGSTLTQQLIKNQMLTSEVTHDRKAAEILLALRLENFFEKEDILEAYLNVVPFGRNASGTQIAGAQSAAEGVFGVDASDLTIAQAAFIAGLPQSPFAYTPFTSQGDVKEDFNAGLNRMNTVLNRMYIHGYITEEELEEAKNYDIRENLTDPQPSSLDEYPFVTDEVRRRAEAKLAPILMEEDGIDLSEIEDEDRRNLLRNRYAEEAAIALQRNGYKIHTTINKEIFDAQQKVVEDFAYFAGNRTDTDTNDEGETVEVTLLEEAASVLIDNNSGGIISFVAGRDYEHQNFNRATQARRPTGSTMKPLLTYGVGFETGDLQPGYITPDTPYQYEANGRDVNNFDLRHLGLMTAREAHARSRNVPAVREFRNIDYDTAREALINYGFERFMTRGEPVESTPLGTLDVTVEANTSAFSTFANEGKRLESYMIDKIETSDGEVIFEQEPTEVEVLSPQANYLMLDVMRDVLQSPGTGSAVPGFLNFNADWAGKTGTSQDIRDSWFVAVNPNVTQSIWMGYDTPQRLSEDAHGMRYGARTQMLWAELANAAHEIDPDLMAPSERFESPGGIVSQSICGISGKLPSDLCREAGLVTTDLFDSRYVPTEEDDSLQRVQYVRVNDGLYKALDSTPREFTRDGVSVNEDYFGFALDGDISEYIPDDWDDLIPDREAPDDGTTPSPLQSLSASGGSISWSDHHEGDVIGYRVYHSAQEGSSFRQVDSVRWDESFSYSGEEGAYYVIAVDVAGRESSPSDEVVIGSYDATEDEDEDEDIPEENNEDEEQENDNDSDNNNDSNNEENNNSDSNDNNNSNNNDNNGTREDDEENDNDNSNNENNSSNNEGNEDNN